MEEEEEEEEEEERCVECTGSRFLIIRDNIAGAEKKLGHHNGEKIYY